MKTILSDDDIKHLTRVTNFETGLVLREARLAEIAALEAQENCAIARRRRILKIAEDQDRAMREQSATRKAHTHRPRTDGSATILQFPKGGKR